MASEDITTILATEFSERFVQGMRARMVMSFYKYGLLSDAYPEKVDALTSLQDRLRKYIETKNTEYLIDAANFAMIEYMFPRLEGAFFQPTDADGSTGRRDAKRGVVDHRPNAELGKNPNSKTAAFR